MTKATGSSAKTANNTANDFDAKFGKNRVTWTISPKVYPLDVVYQASFVFIDKSYMMLDIDDNGNYVVILKGKEPLTKKELTALQGEFFNELLNQAVRKKLSKDNKRLRELIVAKALFSASRPSEMREIMENISQSDRESGDAPRPWDDATKEEQDELDALLAEIEEDFKEDPLGIAVSWDEKFSDKEQKTGEEPTDKD